MTRNASPTKNLKKIKIHKYISGTYRYWIIQRLIYILINVLRTKIMCVREFGLSKTFTVTKSGN